MFIIWTEMSEPQRCKPEVGKVMARGKALFLLKAGLQSCTVNPVIKCNNRATSLGFPDQADPLAETTN